MKPAALLLCLPLLGALSGAAGAQSLPASEVDRASSDRADDLVKRGNAAGKADRWSEAEPLFREAWRLKHSYDIAGNLGLAEAALGKNRDAAEHLSFALRSFPANGKPEHRKLIEETFAKARAAVAALAITCSIDKAEVFVDGRSIGIAPVDGPTFVDPGAHVVEARKEGLPAVRRTVEAPPGSNQPVTIDAPPLPPVGRMKPAVVIAGSALAAVGLGMGIGLFVAADSKKNGTDATRATLVAQGGCPAPSIAVQCNNLSNTLGSASTMHNAAVGTFIGAGVVGVATAAYAVISSRPRSEERRVGRVQITPTFSNAGGGVLLGGRF